MDGQVVQKVTDPQKVVTDEVVIRHLLKNNIDPDYVEFLWDYGPKNSQFPGRSPYSKVYRDRISGQHTAVFSHLPMCRADGTKLKVEFLASGDNYVSDTNLFECVVDGTEFYLELVNDQPSGAKKGDQCVVNVSLLLDDVLVQPKSAKGTLLPVDPVNPNYSNNTIVWDYGICIRRIRIIEGRFKDCWVFNKNPEGEIRFVFDSVGPLQLQFGKVADQRKPSIPISNLTIPVEVWNEAEYPVEVI